MKTLKERQRDYTMRLLRITIEDYSKAHNLPFHEAAKKLAQEKPEVFTPWQKNSR